MNKDTRENNPKKLVFDIPMSCGAFLRTIKWVNLHYHVNILRMGVTSGPGHFTAIQRVPSHGDARFKNK